jgi:hypothetical protein
MNASRNPGRSPRPPFIAFDLVPVRRRRDGWTPERQFAFIAALALCRCVLEACRRVGMSAEAAYKLARRPDAQSFREAWRAALRGPKPQPPHASPPPRRGKAPVLSPSSTSTPQWQLSVSQASSTSAAPAETRAPAPGRPRPPAPAPPRPPRLEPAYSIEAFVRMARRRSSSAMASAIPPTHGEAARRPRRS